MAFLDINFGSPQTRGDRLAHEVFNRVFFFNIDRPYEFSYLDCTVKAQVQSNNIISSNPIPEAGSLFNYSVREGNMIEIQGMIGDEEVVDFAGLKQDVGGSFRNFIDPARLSASLTAAADAYSGGGLGGGARAALRLLEPRVQTILRLFHKWKDQADGLGVFNLIFDLPDLSSQENSVYIIQSIRTVSSNTSGLNAEVNILIKEIKIAEDTELGLFGTPNFQDTVSVVKNLIRTGIF